MKFKFKILFFLFVGLMLTNRSYCQNTTLKNLEKEIDNEGHKKAYIALQKINYSKLTLDDKAYYTYLTAQCLELDNNEAAAYQNYISAKKQYLAIDSLDRAMKINLDITYLISAQENNVTNYQKYLDEYMAYAEKKGDLTLLAHGYITQATHKIDTEEYTQSLGLFKKALRLIKNKNSNLESNINLRIAVLYNERLNKPDSALYYLKKDLPLIKTSGTTEDLCSNYINQAASYHHLGNYQKAIDYLLLADNIPIKKYSLRTQQYIYEFLYKNYDALNDCNNAYKYLSLNQKFADSLSVKDQNIAINDIQVKYETKEKALENSLLKSKIKTNRILLYTFIGALVACLVLGFLIVKNARRKEKISRQEKLIEQQKLEKALKDYELSSIDIMLEGQERERQRIANDLHDNLGSMLATLKLNFENLKMRKNELRDEENKLYDRTDELIEEAYQKVRSLAHAKNAGVFAKEGLIPAIIKLAEKMSIPGKLQLQVIPFGFNERLESTLEIAIFRSIQELTTNIIKHSQATEATIHLTHHDDTINIIIEDNGIGFDPEIDNEKDGMGLRSIQKKIEQLGGTFVIDSVNGRGTTIIIELPV